MKDQDNGSKEKLSDFRRRAELAAVEKSLDVSDVSALSPQKVQQLIRDCKSIKLNWKCKTRNSAEHSKYSKRHETTMRSCMTLLLWVISPWIITG